MSKTSYVLVGQGFKGGPKLSYVFVGQRFKERPKLSYVLVGQGLKEGPKQSYVLVGQGFKGGHLSFMVFIFLHLLHLHKKRGRDQFQTTLKRTIYKLVLV